MASTISAGTTSGTALNFAGDTTGTLAIQTGSTPTTAITVDASQNVTLNNVIPSGSTVPANGMFLPTTNSVGFSTASTERMRIDSSGNLLVGTTSSIIAVSRMSISNNNGVGTGSLSFVNTGASTRKWQIGPDGSGNYVNFNDAGAGTYILYGGTSWTSSSDERLKTDLLPIEDATNKVTTLRAVTGRYKTDEEGKSRSFLIAQDVQKVLPEAVDATDPEKLGVQYTDIIPLLVAAIKELNAKVDAQAAEIQALKGNTPQPADEVTV